MRVTVTYVGGPIDGTTRTEDLQGRTILIPVMPHPPVRIGESDDPITAAYETHRYDLDSVPQYGIARAHYTGFTTT